MKTHEALLTVHALANVLDLQPSWVYDHAEELGGFKLGKYWRFSLPRVMSRLEDGPVGASVVRSSNQRPLPTPTKGEGNNGQGTA
jgi:hypothetical protein